jgi:DNA-directed RNA polymerase specialized sigma24 family protein
MAEIINPMAYFSAAIGNWNKNDYRSNDNFYKHISSVGDENDLQEKLGGDKTVRHGGIDDIEQKLSEASVENWLMFMENERLHKALTSLPKADVQFLFTLSVFNFKAVAVAKFLGITPSAVSRRKRRIIQKILCFF